MPLVVHHSSCMSPLEQVVFLYRLRAAVWRSNRLVCKLSLEVAHVEWALNIWPIRGFAVLALQHLIPVNFGEELMLHDLMWIAEPILRVSRQKS